MADSKSTGKLFYGWLSIIAIALIIGLWGVAMVLTRGHVVTGATQQIAWPMMVPVYVFFALMASGLCLIASISHVFRVESYGLIAKRATLLAIVTLVSGGTLILLDLGQPLRAINFLLYPNLTSLMWWMAFLYGIYLVLIVVEFLLLLRKSDPRTLRVVGSLVLLFAIAAPSTLGALFGVVFARPYFSGEFAPLYFILTAIVSGAALLGFTMTIEHGLARKRMTPELRSFLTADLGKLLALLLGMTIFFVVWKNLAGLYDPEEITSLIYHHRLSQWWYWLFVIVIGLVIPFILMLNPGTRRINGLLVASVLVLIGMFASRFELVLGGQAVALVPGLEHLIWPIAPYSATFTETAIVIFPFALCALLYTLGSKALALEEVQRHVQPGKYEYSGQLAD
ncbi:MAG: polysulfide reductase NrfD [Dehalococcoidia bacterium]|nr:polysulfide reductase NrfD [Dehalococcoidia bacterium]